MGLEKQQTTEDLEIQKKRLEKEQESLIIRYKAINEAINEATKRAIYSSVEGELESFESSFSHHMQDIKESRERMHSLQQEIDAHKKQARDVIAQLQSA